MFLIFGTLTLRAEESLRVRVPLVLGDESLGELWVYPIDGATKNYELEGGEFYSILTKRLSLESQNKISSLKEFSRVNFEQLKAKNIDARFDDENLILFVNFNSADLSETRLSLAQQYDSESGALIIRSAPWSGFINLKGNYNTDSNQQSFYGELDWVHSLGSLRFVNRLSYHGSLEDKFQRRESYLFYDWENLSSRLTAGDLYPRTRSFQRGRSLLGLSYSKESQLQKWWQYQNTASKEIILDSPSTVEIYVNGALRERVEAAAGPLLLDQIPLFSGQNSVELKIKDRFGNQKIIQDLFFHDQALLKKGEHDYSLTTGMASRPFKGDKIYSTDEGYASAYHRYGLLESLELGWNIQGSSETHMLGLESHHINLLGRWGLELSESYSLIDKSGYAALVSWSAPWLFYTTQFEWQSRYFVSPLGSAIIAPFNSRWIQSVSFQDYLNINHGVSFYRTWFYDGINSNTIRYDLRRNFNQQWSAGVSYEQQWMESSHYQIVFSIGWFEPNKNFRSNAEYSTALKNARIDFEHNPNQQVENFYQRASLELQPNQEFFNGELGYEGRRGSVNLDYENDESFDSSRRQSISLGATTALAYTPKALAMGPTVQDSFAIFSAQPQLAKDQELLIGNDPQEPVAIMDRHAPTLLTNLSSQGSRTLLINSRDPATPLFIENEFVRLDPKFYRGLEIEVKQSQPMNLRGILKNFDGQALVYHSGEWKAKDTVGKVLDQGLVFTGASGEFFIESKTKATQFEISLNVPAIFVFNFKLDEAHLNSETIYDLGEIRP